MDTVCHDAWMRARGLLDPATEQEIGELLAEYGGDR